MKTYNFNDEQIQILRDVKDIFVANIAEKRKTNPRDLFDNPVYSHLLGGDYREINQKFKDRLPQVFEELQNTFKV